AADGANYALGEGVLPGRAGCGEDLGDAHGPSSVGQSRRRMCYLDRGGESAAPSHRERPGQFIALSSGSWGIGDVEVRNLPATMQEDHEHVEHSEGRSRDDEEIDRDEVGEVISEERAPSL